MSGRPHLDDGQLSALVDGEGDAADADHAAACDECGPRLASWRDAVRLVGLAPEPPDDAVLPEDSVRESAIAAAMESRSDRKLAQIGGRVALAAAAALIISGVAFAAVHGGGGGHASKESTITRQSVTTPAVPAALPPRATLGSYNSIGQVIAALRPNASSAGVSTPASANANVLQTEPCLAKSADAVGLPSAQPEFFEPLIYKELPAEAFVFAKASDHVVVVVDTSGCRLAATATY